MTPPVGGGRVVVDVQATQSVDQRHRGIPRYVADLAFAIEADHPEAVGVYAVNPDLALPELGISERLLATGKLRRSTDVDWAEIGLLHIPSPLETPASVPCDRLLPPRARAARVPWVVTFHDLVPHLMPDSYLEDPGRRRRYRARLQVVRAATAVVTPSEASRADVVDHLGVDPRRVFVVREGTSARFVPPASRDAAAAAATAAVPGLRAPFVFYIGSYEKRKNLEPLLEAWSYLPEGLRARWQLALCCPLQPLERNHLLWRAAQLGVTDSICLTGFVSDHVLVLLHQGTDLFVFPSLHEGYGLPVAEALACGAPVVAANSSSLPELLDPEALFDTTDPRRMTAMVQRGLTDEGFRQRLMAAAGKAPGSWAQAASETVALYERVLTGDLAPPSASGTSAATSRPAAAQATDGRWRRVAFAGPLPPAGGAIGDWNLRLLEELAAVADLDIHAFADRLPGAGRKLRHLQSLPGVSVHPLASLEAVEGLDGAFDAVIYSLADDEYHTGCLAALRRRSDGVVVAHDVELSGLYGEAARSGAIAEGLEGVVLSAYGKDVLRGAGSCAAMRQGEARRLGIFLARDVVAHCRRLLVTSPAAAALAELDASSADRPKIHLAGTDPREVAAAVSEAVHEMEIEPV